MAKSYGGANWADSLFKGMEQGAELRDTFSKAIDKRKAAKEANVVNTEMTNRLFDVKSKGPIGDWAYNTLGLGDPPEKVRKPGAKPGATPGTPGAAPADAEPMSDARAAAGKGTFTALEPMAEAAPAETPASSPIEVTPVQMAQFAAPAPSVATPGLPLHSPVAREPSALQKKLAEIGVNV